MQRVIQTYIDIDTTFSASWIRDSSFILYALLRLGFTEEANGISFSIGSDRTT